MNRRLVVRIVTALLAVAMLAVPTSALAGKGGGGKNKNKALVVCKHGCKYKTIQKAVNKAKKDGTIKIKPGKYVEGVQVFGKKYNGLTITGTSKNAKKTIVEGKNAQLPDGTGIANNGIEIVDASNVTVKNLWVRNFATNGVFWHDSNSEDDKFTCKNYTADNVDVSFNRSYGLFSFGCVGGTFKNSVGWGHGDSAFYVGATPFQDNPKTMVINNVQSYKNVLGYSGTNSKYIVIKNSDFYNNGAGVVPNTLDSEPFEPTEDSVMQNNNIFWNNFNYYLPNSGVETVSNGLGTLPPELGGGTLQYPTGIGVALFGSSGWTVKNNNIFGNFKWGLAMFSDPFNDGDDAISQNNQVLNNTMGRGGTDRNGIAGQGDFWVDGSGGGNCFSGNTTSGFSPDSNTIPPGATIEQLYPSCPIPNGVQPNNGATGTSTGEINQVLELLGYVTADPPQNQQCAWDEHAHPQFEDFEAVNVTPGPDCS